MHIQIDEVIGRAKQGVTEPYICRSTEKELYYVKGKGAGYPSLIKEWIAGQLAKSLNLPIPTFGIVYVPQELYEIGRKSGLQSLGYGPLFGSREIANANEMSFRNLESLSIELKRDIVAFDWWIMNGDPTLTDAGGNPNIIWSETTHEPYIIDHNLAFDDAVTLNSQLESHMFADALSGICKDSSLQVHYNSQFQGALSHLPRIVDDIPERWLYVDDEESIEIELTIESVETKLKRCNQNTFWERT